MPPEKVLKFIICQGLPGSGKSTWSRLWVNELPKERVRINRDDIRKHLGPYWIPTREKLVTSIEEAMILAALSKGYNVVSDNTNLKGLERFKMLVFNAQNTGLINYEVEFISQSFLDVPVEECIRRDMQREGIERVGEDVIRRMHKSIKK